MDMENISTEVKDKNMMGYGNKEKGMDRESSGLYNHSNSWRDNGIRISYKTLLSCRCSQVSGYNSSSIKIHGR
jgi:hypothetical protein